VYAVPEHVCFSTLDIKLQQVHLPVEVALKPGSRNLDRAVRSFNLAQSTGLASLLGKLQIGVVGPERSGHQLNFLQSKGIKVRFQRLKYRRIRLECDYAASRI